MFKTALMDPCNPERAARTAIPSTRAKINAIPEELDHQDNHQWGKFSTLRPNTSPLVEPKNLSTLNSTGRSVNLVNLKSIEAVQTELKYEFKEEMCGYLRTKLRRMVGKRQEDIAFNRYLNSTI